MTIVYTMCLLVAVISFCVIYLLDRIQKLSDISREHDRRMRKLEREKDALIDSLK